MCRRPLDRRAREQSCYGVQVIRVCRKPQAHGLQRNASAAGCRIENSQRFRRRILPKPSPIHIGQRVGERAGISVRVRAKALSRSIRVGDATPRSHWVPVNPNDVQEPLPIGIRRQQRSEYRRAGGHQRPTRPPDMEPIRRRKRRHRRSLPRALDPDLGDRQPAFDQARVRHGSAMTASPMPAGFGQAASALTVEFQGPSSVPCPASRSDCVRD